MAKKNIRRIHPFFFVLALLLYVSAARVIPISEDEKINMLIEYLANLPNATFIRNGDDHSPKEAAKHLAKKWKKHAKKIKTADDFIKNIASESGRSGEPYKVRFSDGQIITTEVLLKQELARINAMQ